MSSGSSSGQITVTPLRYDLTDDAALAEWSERLAASS
jgi:hypothetical protein